MKKPILAAYDMPPPPPGTPKASSSKKIIAIIVIAVVVVAVVIGAYILMNQNPNNNTSPTTNPTGSPTGNIFEGANSLKFTVTATEASSTEQMSYTYYAKNIGTQNMMLRIDMTIGTDTMAIIVNGVTKQSWANYGGEWMDMSEYFEQDWADWQETWAEMENDLSEWTGTGEWTFTDPGTGDTVTVSGVEKNANLSDSLFSP